jgi:nucleoside-diphosphate-sugar epimerase
MGIVLTGASGFVGQRVLASLTENKHPVRAVLRRPLGSQHAGVQQCLVSGLGAEQDWQEILAGQRVVIHAAARVHVMNEPDRDPLAEFRRVNVEGTLSLARQAAAAGVRRFIFISSIKVNGELTEPGEPFTAEAELAPADPYAVSKKEAEDGLREIAAVSGMEFVIIRPPLVYGPGVKANFLTMMRWLHKSVPLPLGSIHNKRSLVSLDNLADLVMACLEHPAAANQVFLAGDGEDLSTSELLRRMGRALDKPVRLLPVPVGLLRQVGALLGKGGTVQRLCESLQVDISKTESVLGWTPPVGVDAALRDTARHFLATQAR